MKNKTSKLERESNSNYNLKGGHFNIEKKRMNKKGVFGLNAVQQFFVIILGIALLAFVIVVIMGTLSSTNIIPLDTGSATENNKAISAVGYTLGQSGLTGFSGTITSIVNATDGITILAGNYTLTGGVLTNATATTWSDVNITYSFTNEALASGQLDDILGNTSTGITGFFSSITPVYSILAVLVIILILVVLVRVVQTPGGGKDASVQL